MIDWLEGHGVDDVVVSCAHLADEVREALEGIDTGPRLRFVVEPDARGTAGAIKFAEPELGDRFFVLNGDVLCDLDLGALVSQHEATGARATIALYPVEDPSGYGLVHRTEDGEIDGVPREARTRTEIDTDEINAGAYLLERSVLDEIPPDQDVSIEREVFPKLVGNGLYGRRLEGYWIDIGTPERYLQANWDILEGRVQHRGGRAPGRSRACWWRRAPRSATTPSWGRPRCSGRGWRSRPARPSGRARCWARAARWPREATVSGVGPAARLQGRGTARGSADAILAPGVDVVPGFGTAPGAVVGEGERVGGLPE